jgi:hypothetical protein
VRDWLARHPRFAFHFTPTSCSWINAVEGWYAEPTRQRLKRGVVTSIDELQTAINRFIADANGKSKPFSRSMPASFNCSPSRMEARIRLDQIR